MNTKRKIAVGIAGAIVAGTTFGLVGTSHAEEPVPAPTTAQQGGFGFGRQADMAGRGRMGGQMGQRAGYGAQDQAAALAKALDESVEDVTKALADYRADHTPTVRGRDMDDAARTVEHEALATFLADRFGSTKETVLAALDGMHEARQATRTTEIKARLDAAVKAGKLTQEQADAIIAAHQSGAMGGFGRGRR